MIQWSTPTVFLGGVCVVNVKIGLSIRTQIETHLEFFHRDLWLKLGKPQTPGVIFKTGFTSSLRLDFFVWQSRHRQLNDPKLTGFIVKARIVGAVSLLVFVLLISKWT